MPVRRVDDGKNGGLFDFLFYQPSGRSMFLTDEEASALYRLWKTSRNGGKIIIPSAGAEINSLKAKGYITGATEIEITPRGKKVIVEMVTREPSSLEKSSDPPPYSKIKSMANQRPRQSFVQKKGARERPSFNLRSSRLAMRKEAGFWDVVKSPFRDWWAGTKQAVGDWFEEKGASFGSARELWKKVQREQPIAQKNLLQNYQQAQSSGGISPNVVAKSIERLIPVMQEFKNEVGRIVPIPDFPNPSAFADPSTGVITFDSFNNFYNMLSMALGPMLGQKGWNSVLQYEKNKGGAGAAPLAVPKGPEDAVFNNEFKRFMATINRWSPPGATPGSIAPIVNDVAIQKALNDYTPSGGSPTGKKVTDAITEAVMRSGGAQNIDYEAAVIAASIMDQFTNEFSTYRNQLKSSGSHSNELTRWDMMIEKTEANLKNSIANVMRQKYARMFGQQTQPQQQHGRGDA